MSGCDRGCRSGCCDHSAQPLSAGSEMAVPVAPGMSGPSREKRTSRYRRRQGIRRPGTRRLEEILLTVHRYRLVDREIVQQKHFTPKGRSAAQRALTNLWWSRHLDKLPDRAINAPDVYLLSKRASRGLRVLEELVGIDEARSRLQHPATVGHTLAVNHVRAQLEVAARANGLAVEAWQDELDLSNLASDHIVPDAFFQLGRVVEGRRLVSGFFLESELAPVSRQHWRSRLNAYADFYYSGRYEVAFSLPSLRLLIVVRDEGRQRRMILEEAAAARLTIVRLTTAQELRSAPDALRDAIWRTASEPEPRSLYPRGDG